jgi:hypothetical protein
LPAEAMAIAPNVRKYQSVMADIHSGVTLPIGDMPNGGSWTGFQSIKDRRGYFLIFRENNENAKQQLNTYLPKDKTITFTSVLSNGKKGSCKITTDGKIEVALPEKNSYVLYKYVVE